MPGPNVTAIIPTTCCTARRDSLIRAIHSLLDASVCPPVILVVVNGSIVDEKVFSALEEIPDIRILRLAEGSAPLALLAGRRIVETPYFCFLDDDDEYLPGAIDQRLQAMEATPPADLVVSNGWRCSDGGQEIAFDRLPEIQEDPLAALFRYNWLASCGGLYRTGSIGVEYFEEPHPYMEWTWLAFRLANAGLRIRVLNQPGFAIHDTPGSASKSEAYLMSQVSLVQKMIAANRRRDLSKVLSKKLADAHHDVSDNRLGAGRLAEAWNNHLASLSLPTGLRYTSYTARLLLATARRIMRCPA